MLIEVIEPVENEGKGPWTLPFNGRSVNLLPFLMLLGSF